MLTVHTVAGCEWALHISQERDVQAANGGHPHLFIDQVAGCSKLPDTSLNPVPLNCKAMSSTIKRCSSGSGLLAGYTEQMTSL